MTGALTPGRGNRMVLANTEELHDQIDNLCVRIRSLEHALETLQKTVSDQPHPLLRTDILHPSSSESPLSMPGARTSGPSSTIGSTSRSETISDTSLENAIIDAFGVYFSGQSH